MAPVIVAIWTTAAGLTANLILRVYDQAVLVEESGVDYKLHSYVFDRLVEYPLSGKKYQHTWRVSVDSKGNQAFLYYMVDNGVMVPGSDSTSQFTLGGQNGMPMTKRVYKCVTIEPDARYTVTENSAMEYMISHTVTKRGGPYYTPPVSYNVDFIFGVNKLPGTCGGKTLPGLSKTSSLSVNRNGYSIWIYPHVNYDAISGKMIVN